VLVNPKGGFYAEYAVANSDNAMHVPDKLTTEQAGVMLSDALTALQGLDDVLALKRDETIMIFGASGGIGHLAVQLAKRMGARVLAVASGDDGVALAQRLGADAVVNGRKSDVTAAARDFASGGLDAALLTAGGDAADRALASVRDGGRAAFPNGVMPEPKIPSGVSQDTYNVTVNREAIEKLNRLIAAGPFEGHVARTFPLENAADAHRALGQHYLGKLALRVSA
jgi:NADPH:quinone reductase-like Zn-dependent oxidoreductase